MYKKTSSTELVLMLKISLFITLRWVGVYNEIKIRNGTEGLPFKINSFSHSHLRKYYKTELLLANHTSIWNRWIYCQDSEFTVMFSRKNHTLADIFLHHLTWFKVRHDLKFLADQFLFVWIEFSDTWEDLTVFTVTSRFSLQKSSLWLPSSQAAISSLFSS